VFPAASSEGPDSRLSHHSQITKQRRVFGLEWDNECPFNPSGGLSGTMDLVPYGLKRFQESGESHFLPFSDHQTTLGAPFKPFLGLSGIMNAHSILPVA
jgi:hypothetical protein